ncbi:tetratricopeptide repeat protein [Tessaracoccus lapidicaptus]|uniref:tetratricopeptide repeat protein n=1 Tax=Tessaracoccus lapidicaptus TaxID=1427523 RepID=UPI00333E3A25
MPQDFVESQLPAGVKAELRGLPKELAEIVGAHIWAAGRYVDVDPDLAFRHAEAARRRAGRLPIVREAAAETAYAAGEFAVALREFRAIRRLSGGDELIPVIADCERALGRPRDALEVLGELSPTTKDVWLRIECLLVEAGVRADLGQRAEAKRLLQAAISRRVGPPFGQARLRYAYANLLEEDGDLAGAREWFTSAAALDENAELDISDRLATLDGVVLPDFLDEDEEDEPNAEEADESTDAEAGEPIDDEGDEPTDDEADEDDESDVEAEAEPDDDSDGLPADDDEHDEDAERAFDAQAPDSDEEQH